jgi:hypothetical protein
MGEHQCWRQNAGTRKGRIAPVVAVVIRNADGTDVPTTIKRAEIGIAVVIAAVKALQGDDALVEGRYEDAAIEAHHFAAGVIETRQYLGARHRRSLG